MRWCGRTVITADSADTETPSGAAAGGRVGPGYTAAPCHEPPAEPAPGLSPVGQGTRALRPGTCRGGCMASRTPPAFLDIEASGFGRDGYPIEIGFVLSDGEAWRTLVRPSPAGRTGIRPRMRRTASRAISPCATAGRRHAIAPAVTHGCCSWPGGRCAAPVRARSLRGRTG